MVKRTIRLRRRNINFRQTHSERSATRSNITFGRYQRGEGRGTR